MNRLDDATIKKLSLTTLDKESIFRDHSLTIKKAFAWTDSHKRMGKESITGDRSLTVAYLNLWTLSTRKARECVSAVSIYSVDAWLLTYYMIWVFNLQNILFCYKAALNITTYFSRYWLCFICIKESFLQNVKKELLLQIFFFIFFQFYTFLNNILTCIMQFKSKQNKIS